MTGLIYKLYNILLAKHYNCIGRKSDTFTKPFHLNINHKHNKIVYVQYKIRHWFSTSCQQYHCDSHCINVVDLY